MGKIESHRDLVVWRKAMDLVVIIYRLTDHFPSSENFRLMSQITRAAVSIPANVAEGYGRSSTSDYARFLSIARGSLLETETLLMIAVRLNYVTQESAQPALNLMTEVGKMLNALQKSLRP